MKDRLTSRSQVEMHPVQNEYEGKDCSSEENPLFIVVKAKDSNWAPTATKLLGTHQTDSKERHYSMAKVKTGICDYNIGVF